MKRKNKKRMIFIIAFMLIWSVESILFPALNSTKLDCSPNVIEEYQNLPYVGGAVIIENNVSSMYINPNINPESRLHRTILRHENCHLNQIERGFNPTCEDSFLVFLCEVECYSVEKLPDKIFYMSREKKTN